MRTKRIFLFTLIVALFISFPAGIKADDKEIFKDIKESDWFAENVSMLYKLGIINGKPQKDNTVIFDPKGLVTKAEFTKMLIKAMNYNLVDGNTFNDVGYNRHWAKKHIETAVKEGVISPETEGVSYWPDIPIKRNEMALMMFKALKLEPSTNKSPFPDADLDYATKLHEEYLINGALNNEKIYFNPNGLATRAEAAATIARLIEYKENQEEFKKLQKVRNEINSIPVTKVINIQDGKGFATAKEFYKYQSEVLKSPYGLSFENTDCLILKGDSNFEDIAVAYMNWHDPDGLFAFELHILNSYFLDGYKVKFMCENKPEIMIKKVYDERIERTNWRDVKAQSGMSFVYKADYRGDIVYSLEKGELLNFKIFVDSGKEIRSISLTVKVGEDNLYRKQGV